MNLLSNHGILKKSSTSMKGTLKLYTNLKECPGFENYLNLPNKKLR